uniref:Uncharacterized protein n=1 Tax=Chelydra serpentina TaxID=8475 RepID=A0A8C3S3S6_CHESE
MLSQIFILSSKGDRLKRGHCPGGGGGLCLTLLVFPPPPPATQAHKGQNFVHVRHAGLYFAATTGHNVSPFTIIEFLNRGRTGDKPQPQ